MSRPTNDQWLMGVALLTAKRSTCLRRQVGCVLADYKNRVIATGYNGVATGLPHCNDRIDVAPGADDELRRTIETFPHACTGARSPSGTNLDGCQAIHAEQNALLQCANVDEILTCYTTASPCITCVKLLLNTGCRRIVFAEEYPHPAAKELWVAHGGREWEKI